MLYRLLLPYFDHLSESQVDGALRELDCDVIHGSGDRWLLTSLQSGVPDDVPVTIMVIHHECSELRRKSCDEHFHQPRGVHGWVEVRVRSERIDRPARLRARLAALELSKHLELPVLETRNGVYCRTPEAFAAWCARESHPQTISLAKREHMTTARPPTPARRTSTSRPPVAMMHISTSSVPLPKQTWLERVLHHVSNRRTYVITLPDTCERRVIDALVREVRNTFERRNVVYEEDTRRLVIYGKDTAEGRRMIAYFRQRAQPQHLGLAPVQSGL